MIHKLPRLGRFGFVGTGLLVLAGAIDLGAWLWATNSLLVGFEDWRANMAASGLDVHNGTPARSGWPFAAEIVVPAIALSAGTAAWQADAVHLRLTLLHPASLVILPMGHQTLHLAGLLPIGIEARALAANVPLATPGVVAVEGSGITLVTDTGTARIDMVAAQAEPMGANITLSRVTLPGLPFDEPIAAATAELHLTAMPRRSGTLAQSATAWTQAGGQLVADAVSLHWGKLDAEGRFTAGLDAARQVTAQGSVRLTGFDAALDTLARAGTIGRNAATVAKTVLGLMAAGAPATAEGAVDVPFTLRSGTLAMGGIPLARIPLIMWP